MLAWVEAAFRWTHVVAGILWIGHLYFFNFVNAQVVKTYDAESKKKVVPELMPRALYWFRWGALYTWISGILMAGLVYYSVDNLVDKDVTGTAVIPHLAGVAIALALIAIVFFVYDAAWRVVSKNERVVVGIQFGLFVVLLFLLSRIFTGRALFIHAGMLFGTIMVMNVWMRIWPAQRKIIQAAKGVGPAPDPRCLPWRPCARSTTRTCPCRSSSRWSRTIIRPSTAGTVAGSSSPRSWRWGSR